MIYGEYGGTSNTKLLLHLNGNSTNLIGSVASSDTDISYVNGGRFDQCASFNGTSSKITYNDIGTLSIFTISLWVKTTSNIFTCPLCQAGQTNNGFFLCLNETGKLHFEMWTGSASKVLLSNASVNDGNWHNIIMTRNGATVKVYIDGQYDNQSTVMYTFVVGNYYRNLGMKLNSANFYNSLMDEVFIESIEWSATDVSNYYTNTIFNKTLGEFLPTSNTKGLFHMNGNSVNSIGNVSSTDVNVTYPSGKFNQCASFNGTSSFIYLGTSSNYNPSQMTINAWVNPASLAANMDIISRDNTTSKRCYNLGIQSTGAISAELFQTSSVSSAISVTSPTGSIVSNIWYMISLTYDGTTAKVFINGALRGSTACSAIYPWTVESYIGKRRITDSAAIFNGKIDELILENYAWSQEQVKKYYTQSLGRYAIL